MSSPKFKKGDRVVWLQCKLRGVVLSNQVYSNDHVNIGFDVEEATDTSQGSILSKNLEYENVYDSPLYKALA